MSFHFNRILCYFLTSVTLISYAYSSKTLVTDEVLGKESFFYKAALLKYSDDQHSSIESLDIREDMTLAGVVKAFADMKYVTVGFFEMDVTDEELKQLYPVSSYIYGLDLNTSGLNDGSLAVLTGFSELRFLDLRFNDVSTPLLGFFESFSHLAKVSLSTVLMHQKEAVEKLRAALPHITFS